MKRIINRNVLICDPDFLSSWLVSSYLKKKWKISTKWVASGEEAAKELLSDTYDLIITELTTPSRSGFEIINLANQQLQEVPVLVLSSDLTDRNMIEVTRAGAKDFIHKPFNVTELGIRTCRILKCLKK